MKRTLNVSRNQGGFTLLELLVVLMIIALLAGFVGPKLFSNVDQAKEKTALRQMRSLGDALSQYRLDTGSWPSENQGLKALTEKPTNTHNWNGPYLSQQIPQDPWGNHYLWHNPTREKDGLSEVDIMSNGKNGKPLVYRF
ncbi:type II secretion system protein GspG [Pectobacterium parmentieri]|uniref:Type II secretion system core protein G n=1 Tax=Pectobacterium parmentieri TaxID=1905730 RepID=A0A0H3I4N8_PECPM|nr:type II secretion system major pseudopilin GspG [Pectobacterium parmentieri]AFI89658.1 General secretion pathway protein G [Pectobacterium parmentieri]MBI0472082.1 type II secretion system protein GspG [Pectobacterium parmentieri]MBI0495191.1 type II secretion system protein GspG [Pectobacterium parmentieri]MBI0556243.1 type II secretion system protein GspG [Pectobacterium parmentieri]MBI0569327.1 type II secretion system protein GspG [Pectobacterium parmentieri]